MVGLIRDPEAADYLGRADLIGRTRVGIALAPEMYVAGYGNSGGGRRRRRHLESVEARRMLDEFCARIAC